MATKRQADIGIIGGSGLYELEGLEDVRDVRQRTPFGAPSDVFVLGRIDGIEVAFLSRHGRGHRFTPSQINYRANIYGFKALGVKRLMSVSAVGSMKERIKPGEVVVPDQFIDLTRQRKGSFFDQGIVAHVSMADPTCPALAKALLQASQNAGGVVHEGGVYLCIEGPQFSSRAESLVYRGWGVDVIGMTNMPEAKLAREAELCYATLALVTDYDCWHETEEIVSVDAILGIMHKNVALAKRALKDAIRVACELPPCSCGHALEHAILTAPPMAPAAAKKRLRLLLGRYLANS